MTNLFKPNSTILDIEKILVNYCIQPKGGNCILPIHDIPLTDEDVEYMLGFLHTYMNFSGDVSAYYDIRLTILMAWIFSTKIKNQDFTDNFKENMTKIPQHHRRFYLEMFTSTIYEYNIETFGLNFEKEDGICRIILKHAETVS